MMSRVFRVSAVLLIFAGAATTALRAAPPLDYEFFKARVQPIFLQKREGHTRCYVCHAESNNAFRLERLAPGASTWNEEQSRKNFEMVSLLVNPGDPATSRLLQQPLVAGSPGFTSSETISKFLRDCSSFQVLAPGASRSSRNALLLSAWHT